jgi:hypothetical protein
MLKLKMTIDGRPTILIGLSDENITRMRAGDPIHFYLEELGLGEGEMVILTGKDEEAIAMDLENAGLLPKGMGKAAARAAKKPKPRH